MKAIIVGGGIGGLTTALMLRARGIDCELFEQADSIRELGVGGESCRAVLDWHSAGVLDAGRTEASQPADNQPRENDRSAQRRRHCRKSPQVHIAASKGSI